MKSTYRCYVCAAWPNENYFGAQNSLRLSGLNSYLPFLQRKKTHPDRLPDLLLII